MACENNNKKIYTELYSLTATTNKKLEDRWLENEMSHFNFSNVS